MLVIYFHHYKIPHRPILILFAKSRQGGFAVGMYFMHWCYEITSTWFVHRLLWGSVLKCCAWYKFLMILIGKIDPHPRPNTEFS